jgi:hypothetical protein
LTFAFGLFAGLLFGLTALILSWESPDTWPWWCFVIAGAAFASGIAALRLAGYLQTSYLWPLIGAAIGFGAPWALLVAAFCGDGQCSGE